MKHDKIKYKLSRNALIMFVGINPHPGSYVRTVPFSNNKMFWYILARSGVINESEEDLKDDIKLKEIYENKLVQAYNVNFINLVDRPTRGVSEIERGEERPGLARFISAVKRYRPKLICFVGKITYQKFTGLKRTSYGFKPDIEGIPAYVSRFPIRGKASVRIREMKMLLSKAKSISLQK